MMVGCSRHDKWLQPVKWKKDLTQVDKAVNLYEEGLKLETDGDTAGAMVKYEDSIKLSPRPVTYYRLGRLESEKGNTDKAIELLKKAVELSPGYEDAQLLLNRLQSAK
mgnify:FL=1